jgi:hypothetical protein
LAKNLTAARSLNKQTFIGGLTKNVSQNEKVNSAWVLMTDTTA